MSHDKAQIGVLGKHPGYGDFVRAGFSDTIADLIDKWLDHTLTQLRDQLGNDWQVYWDHAQTLRFWIGRGVMGRTLAGVLAPSRDRGGRRYPLVIAAEAPALDAPMREGADQSPWDQIEAHLALAKPGQGGVALLDGLQLDIDAEDAISQSLGATVWAHHPEGNLQALLASAGPVDAERALLTRSYWWAPGKEARSAVWLGCPGLPSPEALQWLLGGVAAAPDPIQEGT